MFYIGFTITSLVYTSILIAIYYSKKRINIFENKLIMAIMVTNVIGSILHLLCYWASINVTELYFLKMAILKSYIIYICVFNHLLSLYILLLTNNQYKSESFKPKKYLKKKKGRLPQRQAAFSFFIP